MQEIGYRGCYSVEFESFSHFRNILKGDALEAARLSWRHIQALVGG